MRQKRLNKKIYHYTAIFESDQEAGGFTATIPSLPGCISEGDTFEEALENIQEAIRINRKRIFGSDLILEYKYNPFVLE